jgi:hypothetical protein
MLRGIVGHVKWHYYTAAAINGYTVTRTEGGGLSLVATVVMHDAFKLAQRPLVFEAPHKAGVWKWPIVAHTLTEAGRLTATLGPEILTTYNGEPPKDLWIDSQTPKP